MGKERGVDKTRQIRERSGEEEVLSVDLSRTKGKKEKGERERKVLVPRPHATLTERKRSCRDRGRGSHQAGWLILSAARLSILARRRTNADCRRRRRRETSSFVAKSAGRRHLRLPRRPPPITPRSTIQPLLQDFLPRKERLRSKRYYGV